MSCPSATSASLPVPLLQKHVSSVCLPQQNHLSRPNSSSLAIAAGASAIVYAVSTAQTPHFPLLPSFPFSPLPPPTPMLPPHPAFVCTHPHLILYPSINLSRQSDPSLPPHLCPSLLLLYLLISPMLPSLSSFSAHITANPLHLPALTGITLVLCYGSCGDCTQPLRQPRRFVETSGRSRTPGDGKLWKSALLSSRKRGPCPSL